MFMNEKADKNGLGIYTVDYYETALFLLVLYIFSFAFGLPIASLMLVNFFNESQDFKWNKAMIVFMTLVTLVVVRFITIIPFVGWLVGLLLIGASYGAFIQIWIQARKELKVENPD